VKSADSVKVTTFVGVSPREAFEIFTAEIDLWWRRGPRYRMSGGSARKGTLRFEGSAERRLVEAFEDGEVFEIGRVLAWEPAERLLLEWRARNFTRDEQTEVEVRFEPSGAGTRVVIEHRGWASIREDHPARHGLVGGAFTAMIGLWWGELATSLRGYAAERGE
jgi:uncharacterized protein YndB with AHSA1/START domain